MATIKASVERCVEDHVSTRTECDQSSRNTEIPHLLKVGQPAAERGRLDMYS